MATPDPLKLAIGKAMGRIPSGLFILTAETPERSGAQLLSWVQQAAFTPPAVSAAMAKDRPVRPLIEASRAFGISILSESDKALLKRYARGLPPDEDPFAGVNVMRISTGTPVLADALAYLDCRLLQVADFGADHDLFIAEVVGGDLLRPGASFTHLRGNGFHY